MGLGTDSRSASSTGALTDWDRAICRFRRANGVEARWRALSRGPPPRRFSRSGYVRSRHTENSSRSRLLRRPPRPTFSHSKGAKLDEFISRRRCPSAQSPHPRLGPRAARSEPGRPRSCEGCHIPLEQPRHTSRILGTPLPAKIFCAALQARLLRHRPIPCQA